MILTLLLLTLPADIKAQTQRHLMAMQSISATETVGKDSYRVAMFGGQQAGARPPTYHGVYVDRAWFVLLRDSQVWRWEDADGNTVVSRISDRGGLYSYRDICPFRDRDQVRQIPCSGTIEVVGYDIRRITQTLKTTRWGTITLDVEYGFVPLSIPRLVPIMGMLRWADKETRVTWADYREFRCNEPRITEAEADDEPRATIQEGTTPNWTTHKTTEGIHVPVGRELERQDTVQGQGQSDSRPLNNNPVGLLTQPAGDVQQVKLRKWWKIWRR